MIHALKTAVATLLTTEATFVTAMAALGFGTHGELAAPTTVLRSFRPFRTVGQENYPCWIFESGDIQTIEQAINSCHQTLETEILFALLWHQQDHDTAADQRDKVVDEVVQLFLRHPCPGDIADTWVDAVGNDRSANHPTHVIVFRALANVDITRPPA